MMEKLLLIKNFMLSQLSVAADMLCNIRHLHRIHSREDSLIQNLMPAEAVIVVFAAITIEMLLAYIEWARFLCFEFELLDEPLNCSLHSRSSL